MRLAVGALNAMGKPASADNYSLNSKSFFDFG
jgi:hypothetical protein